MLRIAKSLSYCSSSEFKELLDNFYNEFGDFLSEKTREPLGVADVSVKKPQTKMADLFILTKGSEVPILA